ncbi:MAG: TRAM domain-containing protein [Candidatus Woesearchaeota archaeon]
MERKRGFKSRAPVKVNDELELDIVAQGKAGDGIGKKDGFVIFVPNAKEGEHVKVRITKVAKKVAFSEKI